MKLLDQLRRKLRLQHYAIRTEDAYVRWVERYLRFHKDGPHWRHPTELGVPHIEAFLTHLAADRTVTPSTVASTEASCSARANSTVYRSPRLIRTARTFPLK